MKDFCLEHGWDYSAVNSYCPYCKIEELEKQKEKLKKLLRLSLATINNFCITLDPEFVTEIHKALEE